MNIEVCAKRINFLVSKECNLRCRMCDYAINESHRKELSLEQIERLLCDAADLGAEKLALSGGEPMMRKDITDILSLSRRYNIKPSLVTNGTLINEDNAEKLVDAGLNGLNISLEGFEELNDTIRGKGTFRKAVNAIRVMQRYRDRLQFVTVGVTLSKANYRELYSFTRYLSEELGVDSVSFNPFNQEMLRETTYEGIQDMFLITADMMDDLKNELEKIIEYSKTSKASLPPDYYLRKIPDYFGGKKTPPGFPCCEPLTSCAVNCSGEVFACWGVPVPVGDITKSSLKDIVASKEYKDVCRLGLTLKCGGCLKACHLTAHSTDF